MELSECQGKAVMQYRATTTVFQTGQIVLAGLPFSPGEQVDVVVTPRDSATDAPSDEEIQRLFRVTQSLPAVQCLADDEIAAEIAAIRSVR
jgi:hypothetical protein